MRELLRTIDAERPVLLAGPTASGKSALAMEIAAERGGVIVNADALQVYSCWRVLTARPTADDEAAVPHYLYGHVPGQRAYSVGDWLRDLAPLFGNARPIIVGGTGLYFTRLTRGLAEIPPVPRQVREAAAARSPAELIAELDGETLARIDRRNPARVRRAWEVLRATGRGLAAWQDEPAVPLLPRDRAQAFVVEVEPGELGVRIRRRAQAMLAAGAVAEVADALRELGPDAPAMKAIGASEIAAYITDDVPADAALARLVVATRQYAKRQRTWFRSNMRDWRPIRFG